MRRRKGRRIMDEKKAAPKITETTENIAPNADENAAPATEQAEPVGGWIITPDGKRIPRADYVE